MNFKLFFVLFLSVALLVSISEAGKDRRKKQKQKERSDSDDETMEESAAGERGISKDGKQDEKERTSVMEKQTEKKDENESSSSEEKDEDDDEDKKNSTVIIRKKRNDQVQLSRVIRAAAKVWGAEVASDEGWVLPTDPIKVKRDTVTQMQKSKEINDGAQLPLEKKPAVTAAPSN